MQVGDIARDGLVRGLLCHDRVSCSPGPIVSQPQLGCALIVHQHAAAIGTPRVEVVRDDVRVDIAGAVYREQVVLPVSYVQYTCDGEVESVDKRDEVFDVFHIGIDDGRTGEQLYVNDLPAGTIDSFTTFCSGNRTPTFGCGIACDEVDGAKGGGCHTSGNSCGAAVTTALVAALVVARRRRHVRARTATGA